MLKQFLGESWNLAVPFSSNLNESQFVATIAEKPVMDSFEKQLDTTFLKQAFNLFILLKI